MGNDHAETAASRLVFLSEHSSRNMKHDMTRAFCFFNFAFLPRCMARSTLRTVPVMLEMGDDGGRMVVGGWGAKAFGCLFDPGSFRFSLATGDGVAIVSV